MLKLSFFLYCCFFITVQAVSIPNDNCIRFLSEYCKKQLNTTSPRDPCVIHIPRAPVELLRFKKEDDTYYEYEEPDDNDPWKKRFPLLHKIVSQFKNWMKDIDALVCGIVRQEKKTEKMLPCIYEAVAFLRIHRNQTMRQFLDCMSTVTSKAEQNLQCYADPFQCEYAKFSKMTLELVTKFEDCASNTCPLYCLAQMGGSIFDELVAAAHLIVVIVCKGSGSAQQLASDTTACLETAWEGNVVQRGVKDKFLSCINIAQYKKEEKKSNRKRKNKKLNRGGEGEDEGEMEWENEGEMEWENEGEMEEEMEED